jgi:hypothetical protein
VSQSVCLYAVRDTEPPTRCQEHDELERGRTAIELEKLIHEVRKPAVHDSLRKDAVASRGFLEERP